MSWRCWFVLTKPVCVWKRLILHNQHTNTHKIYSNLTANEETIIFQSSTSTYYLSPVFFSMYHMSFNFQQTKRAWPLLNKRPKTQVMKENVYWERESQNEKGKRNNFWKARVLTIHVKTEETKQSSHSFFPLWWIPSQTQAEYQITPSRTHSALHKV